MARIAEHFRSRDFIADIVLVPDYYLRDARGFEGLVGVQRLYGVDLMALVSYDQVRYQDDRGLAAGYLTVAGRRAAAAGFDAAADHLIEHFDVALGQLEADIRAGKSTVKVRARDGGGGGAGALDGPGVALLGVLVLLVIRRRPGLRSAGIHCNDSDIYARFAAFGVAAEGACRKKMPFRWKVRSSRPCPTRRSASA